MIFNIDIPIYRCSVAFFLETTVDELGVFYNKNRKCLDEEDYRLLRNDIEDTKKTGGVCYTFGVNYIVYIRDTKKMGHCDHELWHLTNSILMDRGVEHTLHDEPYAYLNEYLHDEFRNLMKDFNKEKRNEKAGRTSGDGSGEHQENQETDRGVHSGQTV